jgi:CheY-like chemotaxis protein
MCHVLVIEDEWLIGEHIEAIALDAGATTVDRAETEQQAVAAAIASPPAVILSDVRLAEGTGPGAVATIRERLGPCPVIFITGTPEACEPCDYAHAILEKPLQPYSIAEAFRQVAPV